MVLAVAGVRAMVVVVVVTVAVAVAIGVFVIVVLGGVVGRLVRGAGNSVRLLGAIAATAVGTHSCSSLSERFGIWYFGFLVIFWRITLGSSPCCDQRAGEGNER